MEVQVKGQEASLIGAGDSMGRGQFDPLKQASVLCRSWSPGFREACGCWPQTAPHKSSGPLGPDDLWWPGEWWSSVCVF